MPYRITTDRAMLWGQTVSFTYEEVTHHVTFDDAGVALYDDCDVIPDEIADHIASQNEAGFYEIIPLKEPGLIDKMTGNDELEEDEDGDPATPRRARRGRPKKSEKDDDKDDEEKDEKDEE